MQLVEVLENIQSEIKTSGEGQSVVSIRGAARLAGINDAGLGRALQTSADQTGSKLAEYLISKGLKGADLNQYCATGIPDLALSKILNYYAFKAGRYCTELAELCCEAFQAIGVRTWLQQATGWQSKGALINQADEIVGQFKQLKTTSKVTARIVFEEIALEAGIDLNAVTVSPQQSKADNELALNSSLVANRLGLAFNKHIKAFQAIQDATSPGAFNKLKSQHEALMEDYQNLLEKQQPSENLVKMVETVIELREKLKEYELRYLQVQVELNNLKNRSKTDETIDKLNNLLKKPKTDN